jgi:steroid 5-alpha reductase family enzyme
LIKFDGCPLGAGAYVIPVGIENLSQVLAWWSEVFPWIGKDPVYSSSNYQNNSELVGFILVAAWAARLKYHPGVGLLVEGDSVTVFKVVIW